MTYVGTAGWALPRACQDAFAGTDSHLARYARVLPGAEINSSFHRPHRASTYARWAASVPASFRFSVKLPRTITHTARLVDVDALLDEFLAGIAPLGERLGCLLVQLPPSLAFAVPVADAFLAALRTRHAGPVALEPRHATWFGAEADSLLRHHRVARVAADPARAPGAEAPGGDPALAYWRLHGSPRVYWSAYDEAWLVALAARIRAWHAADPAARRASWCIFDNTTAGAATPNALRLRELLGQSIGRSSP